MNRTFCFAAALAVASLSAAPSYAGIDEGIAAQLKDVKAMIAAWPSGQPMPVGGGASGGGAQVAAAARASDRCSAIGAMEGEDFSATHCAISLYGDQHSVAIWFNEDAITPDEAVAFQLSSYAGEDKAGKRRTRVQIMFCPGGSGSNVSPSAVKSIDFNTSHAKSAISGVQWVVEAPKDFKVEKLSGKLEPGGTLSGRIVGQRAKTSWTIDFDLNLPTKDSAAGISCGK